jgi:(1->4)-alpha-D-glucan 1-alpha-D-glucosylmutase
VSELRATYRLQLTGGFGFAAARELVPYLRDLGVSHLYLPPCFQARAGSQHGYDVTDPREISRELGGEEAFRALCADARAAGLGVILDVVPNHMAADDANEFWTRRREQFFDLDAETGHWRRFFAVDHLAGVRVEDPEVFEATHALALRLVEEQVVDGLRIDHPDGLADPAGYLHRLHARGVEWIWVEKILINSHPPEHLRPDWPVQGTVGYEFLNDACALFVDPAGEAPLTALWEEVAQDDRPFGAWASEAKLEWARGPFAREMERLRREAGRDLPDLEDAVSSLSVYRTYVRDGVPSEEDVRVLSEAGCEWVLGMPAAFITRFQQTTPAVMAKGVEDTAFYRYARLLALCDVGGDPSRFSLPVAAFHRANAERAQRYPRNLLITQTHDTKRSGDVRARIGALAAMPDAWAAFARRWMERIEAGDSIERLFLLQTLVSARPIEPERLTGYLEKALRERDVTTHHSEPDEAHESALFAAALGLLEDPEFLAEFEPLAAEVARVGDRHALGQLLLKLTVPGVPDIYNGDELESLSLVDPDNRRPVDWPLRRRALEAVRAGEPPAGVAGARKLWLIVRALELRARRPASFLGSYEAVEAEPGICAFMRGEDVAVAVAVREGWPAEPPGFGDGPWHDVLGGELTWERDGLLLRERA